MKNNRAGGGWGGRMLLGLALGCGLAGGGCAPKAAPDQRPPSPVTVATARMADVPVMLDTFGRLRALSDVDIKAQVSGKIVEAPFSEGARVEKGAVLFRIETDAYQATADQAAAQVASATAALAQKQATLERNKQLLAQALVAQEDYDKLATDVDTARAQLDQARATLAQAQVDLERCVIVSPIAGVTGRRLVDVGNVVAASASQALVNVRAVDQLYLDFTLSEAHLPEVRQAMADGTVDVLLVAESPAGQTGMHSGVLKLIDNAVDTQSGTILLRALVDNPAGELWPGQFVYVYPILRTLAKAVIVPLSAVTQGKTGPYAFVAVDGKAELRAVEKGPAIGDAVVVTKGVAVDDVVVTTGQMGVWPGAALQVKTETSDADKAQVQKRLDNPNVLNLIRVLAARGETPEQIALIVGLPAAQVQAVVNVPGKTP